jgi:protein-S-isoprenylcysteine O-methyltransferase Ste14
MSNLALYLLSLFLMVVVSLLVLRVFVRRDYLHGGCLSTRSAILQALVFFVYGGFPSIYLPGYWPVSHVDLPLRIMGLTSLTIGLVIMLIGIYRLGLLRALGLQTNGLKKTSYYQVTRNPQVFGCVLYIIGFVILWPSWFALGWGLSLMVILHVMVLTEEEHLRNAYGQDYELYCKSVPRYLGIPKNSE